MEHTKPLPAPSPSIIFHDLGDEFQSLRLCRPMTLLTSVCLGEANFQPQHSASARSPIAASHVSSGPPAPFILADEHLAHCSQHLTRLRLSQRLRCEMTHLHLLHPGT